MTDGSRLTIMVSSAVYGMEELLDLIYTLLTSFGYEVWMSHKGTVPVFSTRSAFENCIAAVENCDLFLGLITPNYGSGKDEGDISITHQELKTALALNKPRWLLVHDHVVFARSLLNNLGYTANSERNTLTLRKNQIMDDLRVIDMYEEAILEGTGIPVQARGGNWVQKFSSNDDAALFATAQFSRYQEVEAFVRENLGDRGRVSHVIEERGDRP